MYRSFGKCCFITIIVDLSKHFCVIRKLQYVAFYIVVQVVPHLSATAAVTPHFSMDRPNYSGWFLIYMLSETHPAVSEEFMFDKHAISRSTQHFAQMWIDMTLEQSTNLHSKTSGGIVGISQRPGALERWFLTCHERAAITTVMKEMCAIQDSDRDDTHREAVRKLLTVITSELMTDPFSLYEDDGDISTLVNIATGIRIQNA